MIRNGPNYRKGGKNFQKFEKVSINSKKFKTFQIFTQLSSKLQTRIPGDPAGGIHYHFFQVLTHTLLFHFDAIFIKFHGHLRFLGQTKKGVVAHTEIEGFSVYRVGYTWKMPSQSCTYMIVWKTVVYAAAHEIF